MKQQNLDKLESIVLDISNPYSKNYGNYLSKKEIDNIIGTPSYEKDLIYNWLYNYDITITEYSDYIKCHGKTNMIHKMVNEMPQDLPIDFIDWNTNLLKFIRSKRSMRSNNIVDSGVITREVLERLYNFSGIKVDKMVSIGPMEYNGYNGFSENNLVISEQYNGLEANPVPKKNIIGPNKSWDPESVLDIQFVGQTAADADLWYENFSGWMYKWAVDFYNRERTPHIVTLSYGWSETAQCDIINCTHTTSEKYVARTNAEFMKLAAKGVTIVVSSGDAGSPGRTNENCDANDVNHYNNPVFPGSSPWVTSVGATYLVKGNEQYNYTTKVCELEGCAMGKIEQGTTYNMTGWTSGSGFDRWISRPYWQAKVVKKYLESGIELPNDKYWNRNGRGYPDVTALGHNCDVYMGGYWYPMDGTSCSAPIFGGIIAIMNHHQLKQGKPLIGYANPLLYYMYNNQPDTFNDITVGNSTCTEVRCCGKNFGFLATKGWDPIGGLGSPNVGKILEWLDKNTC